MASIGKSSMILYNDLDYHVPSGDDPQTEQKSSLPDTPQSLCARHRCRIFDIPSLLFDKRWLGTDEIVIELYATGLDRTKAVTQIFRQKCGQLKGDFAPGGNTLKISHIEADAKMEAEPLLSLVDFCLWLQPNKLDKIPADIRVKVESQPYKFEAVMTECLGHVLRNQKFLLKQLKRLAVPSQQGQGKQANEKGKAAFEKLEKKKNALAELWRSQQGNITEMHSCLACDQILLVLGKKKGPSVATVEERQAVETKVTSISGKLSQAQGSNNRQKRKKLKRKLQKLKGALDTNAQQPQQNAANTNSADSDVFSNVDLSLNNAATEEAGSANETS